MINQFPRCCWVGGVGDGVSFPLSFFLSPPLVPHNVNIQPLICFSKLYYYFFIIFCRSGFPIDRGFLSIPKFVVSIGTSYRSPVPLRSSPVKVNESPTPIGIPYRFVYIFLKSNFKVGGSGGMGG